MEIIVLAGGLGTRLRSVVQDLPKCMAPVAGKPFLEYLLNWLCQEEATHIVFSVGYLREQVMDYVGSRPWPFRYDFAIENEPLGTGGGIRLALGYCTEDKVFVVNGDTFFPVRLADMPSLSPITLALKPMRGFSRYGAVSVQETPGQAGGNDSIIPGGDGRVMPGGTGHLQVTAFQEKRYCEEGLISGGVYLLRPQAINLELLPAKFSFEKEVLEPGAAIGQIGGWVSDAYFIDIGVPEDYALSQQELPEWQAVAKASKAVLEAGADTLFLDRDGVINRHLPGDYVRCPQQFVFLPGILEALAAWSAKFRRIVLVTNQRGVGRGLMTDADLSQVHAFMMARILEAGGRIDLILTCTAVDEKDPRRKPQTGMFQEALQMFPKIRPERSVMLGDSPSDEAFARNCGMPFILLEAPAAAF